MPTGSERILVLEDDISVRHISVRVLRSLGYDVIEAANGDDAQQLIGKSADRKIDLLLTDMVMPQMSGRCFADWLRQANPQTKVVFISGYLEESLVTATAATGKCFSCPSLSIPSSSPRRFARRSIRRKARLRPRVPPKTLPLLAARYMNFTWSR